MGQMGDFVVTTRLPLCASDFSVYAEHGEPRRCFVFAESSAYHLLC